MNTVELQRLRNLKSGIDYVLDYLDNPRLSKLLQDELRKTAVRIMSIVEGETE